MSQPGAPRVLVADDQRLVREVTVAFLEAEGFQVSAASDGEGALQLAREGAFDALVLDVVMPRMGGAQVYRALAARDPRLVFLFTTGMGERELPEEARRDPRCRVLIKPFSMQALAACLRGALDRR